MPQQHKKRGKRGEKKRKREEDEDSHSKRQKYEEREWQPRRASPDYGLGVGGIGPDMIHPERASKISPDHSVDGPGDRPFIPLETKPTASDESSTNIITESEAFVSYGSGAAVEDEFTSSFEPRVGVSEFYGLLDEEEQAYFKRADQMLDLNQFVAADERALFVENVWNEARGKELKLANSQSCSRLLERLIQCSSTDQLKNLVQKFKGHFLSLVQHRFASHCCEALFMHCAPVVTEELIGNSNQESSIPDEVQSMEQLFLGAVSELQDNIGYLMTDKFATHSVRVLLVILSGRPLIDTATMSLLKSKSKESSAASYVDFTSANRMVSRQVPESFGTSLDGVVSRMIGTLDSNYLRALATQPIANPVLQLLLGIEFGRAGKQAAKDDQSLFRKLLPDQALDENSDDAKFIRGLLYDPTGSHLLETIVVHCPGKAFKAIYNNHFRASLKSVVRNDNASYVLIKTLDRLSAADLQDVLKKISSEIPSLIEQSRTSVLQTLIERYHVRQIADSGIAEVFGNHYRPLTSTSLDQMLGLNADSLAEVSHERKQLLQAQGGRKLHSSLLLQKMLEYPGSLRELINDAVLLASSETLLTAALDSSGSYVIQVSLKCAGQSKIFRRQALQKFTGKAGELALDPVGSHVLDALWRATIDLQFLREQIAQELASSEDSLRDSHCGRIVWRTWMMDLFLNNKKSWIVRSKHSDHEAGVGDVPRQRTGIEKAREEYAAKKELGHQRSDTSKRQSKPLWKTNSVPTRSSIRASGH